MFKLQCFAKVALVGMLCPPAFAFENGSLSEAAYYEDLPRMIALLENGADINERDDTGRTPLSWAMSGLTFENIAFLVENGADVNIRDEYGYGHMYALCLQRGEDRKSRALEVARLLVKAGYVADANERDNCRRNEPAILDILE